MYRSPLANRQDPAVEGGLPDPRPDASPGAAIAGARSPGERVRALASLPAIAARIAKNDPLSAILGEIVGHLDAAAAPAVCAIAVRAPDGALTIGAAPGIPETHWPTNTAGIEVALQARRGSGSPAAGNALALAESAAAGLVWCRPIDEADGATTIACIAVFGLGPGRPAPSLTAAIEQFAPLVQLAVQRDRVAHKLRIANERFAAVTANIPGVVYQRHVSPAGEIRYTYISEGARDLFGVSPEEIVSDPKALFSCHAPSYRKDFRERLLEASRTLTPWDVEAEIISRDGTRKWTHAAARPSRLPDGTVQWDGIILDATRIVDRELALKQQKEAAEIAKRGMSEFIASMSHELRTPLNAIIGFSELMKEQTLGALGNPRYQAYCSDILDSGRHLLNIVNDVLDISKIESGKLSLNEEPVDLAEIVQGVMLQLRPRADAGGVTMATEIAEDFPYLQADQRLVKQMLLNLVSNAVKFTEAGGSVTIAAAESADGIAVAVRDTGIGMQPADIPRAMERFSQIDNTLSRKHEGTGLGLYLVKLFAGLHQASIRLESAPKAGTTATLVFPNSRRVAR